MSNEKLRILKMIKDGTLTPEEGLEIISALDDSTRPMGPITKTRTYEIKPMQGCCADADCPGISIKTRPLTEAEKTPPFMCGITVRDSEGSDQAQPDEEKSAPEDPGEARGKTGRKARWLRIKVDDQESGKHVNVRIPISLAKAAGKFIPKQVKAEMAEEGIELDIDAILRTLEAEGPNNLVEITDGDNKVVMIYAE